MQAEADGSNPDRNSRPLPVAIDLWGGYAPRGVLQLAGCLAPLRSDITCASLIGLLLTLPGDCRVSKLLYIESSPRKARSKSIKVANAFVENYKATHPGDEVVTIDLWKMTLPEFDGYTIDAKYQVMHGQGHDAEQAAAWKTVVDVIEEFKSADKYLFSLPMWNFGIPYKLKHYIDVIAQPGQTFSFSPETGYSGLVTGKPVAVVYARGGAYGSDQTKGMDFQMTYMQLLLGFIGFTEIQSVVVEPTLASAEDVAKTEAAAVEQAEQLAASF
ncbi:FMN-dependent NADH-azoreductase [Rosistilla ulvae]|uniref:FMN dependent NADH:quinone oxidoreductase n=1 Tax=Rosistilla ulvae TaxID=1930277 RepID=A0A517M162_9BACT|nr:NAD(P)H-dependent oxidoreductase [Rosistilla ulvae]QDS88612.1 FMN-dependent NADH-azoreductase [Rosistilla ulvae]